jgi:flagellar motor switch protein FliG
MTAGRGAAIQLSPPQRAAVVIALLGEAAAKPIVDRLGDGELATMTQALSGLSVLPRAEVMAVVMEFFQQIQNAAGALHGGPARAREVLSALIDPARVQAVFGDAETVRPSAGQTGDTWARLSAADPQQIAAYLNAHAPPTIARILRKLDMVRVSAILIHLQDDKLGPTLGAMVDNPATDPAIEAIFARMLEAELLQVAAVSSDAVGAHLEGIGEMLSLLPEARRDTLVDFLAVGHAAQLDIIRQGLLTIAAVPVILPRPSVPVVLRELEGEAAIRLLASLRGAHEAVSEFLLANVSSRMAEQFREDLKTFAALPAAEAEATQTAFLQLLMTLKRKGTITLTRTAEG